MRRRLAVIGLTVLAVLAGATPALAAGSKRHGPPHEAAELDSVSCVSTTHCVAVGWAGRTNGRVTLVEVFNGSKWHVVATPNPAGYAYASLADVDCVSASHCVAVGEAFNNTATPRYHGIVEVFNGTKWRVAKSPWVAGSALTSVSCVSTSHCVAVGGTQHGTLIETFNGTKWRVTSHPASTGSDPFFTDVSCGSSSACVVVGEYDTASGGYSALMQTLHNGAWHRAPLPALRKGQLSYLSGVSCTATSCVAVGYHRAGSGATAGNAPLVETRRNGSWHLDATPAPKNNVDSQLFGVDCVSATHCVAFGSTDTQSRGYELAATYRGAKWVFTRPAEPARVQRVFINRLSCVTATFCVAVGGFYSYSGTAPMLAAVHTANGWKQTVLPTPKGAV